MTATIPTTEPTRLIAGDTAKWLKTLADYPASAGWALVYTLINATNKITIAATAQGDDHLVTVSKTTTAAWVAGTYDYRAQASLGAESYTVASGRMVVEASFGAATLDNRSSSQKMLDSVEAVMLKTAGSNVLEYEIAGRRLKHYSMSELLQLRDRLKGEVAKETAAAQLANAGTSGQGSPVGRIYVRFGA